MSNPAVAGQTSAAPSTLSTLACTPVQVTDKRSEGLLFIEWADHQLTQVSHLELRLNCRCAECVAKRQILDSEKGSTDEPHCEFEKDLRIETIEPIAYHALNFRFSDGHHRGIYPWPYLRSLSCTVE